MRSLYFLLPGTTGKFACGGLWAELKTVALAQEICMAEVVTYRQREPGKKFLDDVLRQPGLEQVIFLISWGFDVPKLARRLWGQNVVYHAHSAEYGFWLPAHVPIITVSRHTLSYWGQRSPHALLYYLPNQIADEFYNQSLDRDIDVLVQVRKSSRYLLHTLIPALRHRCRVEVVASFVDDLPGLFNRAKVYLYDSAEYWAQQGVSEGFGLQPLEAMTCGCRVFSSVNGGLADYLDPGFNCQKIAGYSTDYDVRRILQCLKTWEPAQLPPEQLAEYRRDNIYQKLALILHDLNEFFDYLPHADARIPDITFWSLWQLRWQRLLKKLGQ
jgi:glycosyltransferase involved in cell wall biosynthesis